MRTCQWSVAPGALFIAAFVALGCMASEEEIPATEAPTTTGIPVGAPGAVGARVEAAAPKAPPRLPPPEPYEQKINPGPGQEPVIPPSPFGTPPADEQPPGTTKKKLKGTKI